MKPHRSQSSILTRLTYLCALLALVSPLSAFAGTANPAGATAWTVYAFANGNTIYNILQAATGLVSSSAYWALLGFLVTVGIIGLSIAAAHRSASAGKIVGTFIAIVALTNIGLKTTATVYITDTVTGYSNTLSNVPLLIALPEAIASTAGYSITKTLEQFFTIPGDLTVSGGGFNLANSLVQASTEVQVTDPNVRATLAAFTQNCIVPSIVSGRISPYAMIKSSDLWGTSGPLSLVDGSPLTPVYTDTQPAGAMVPCGPSGVGGNTPTATNTTPAVSGQDAFDYLRSFFAAAAPGWLADSASTYGNTSAYSWLSGSMASAQSFLFGGALTSGSGQSIEQAAAINALRPALNAAEIASGNSAAVTAMAISQAKQSQVSSWGTAAVIFRDMSGYLYSVLQAFLIAMTPLIIAAAFIPGAGKRLLISYTQVIIWLALWEPTLALVNFIIDSYSQGQMGGVLGSSGGYSMANMGAVTQMTSHLVLAGGFLASMVPLITWGLVKGGIAFTEFLAGGMGAALASQAGSAAATGNLSLGNKSFNNTSIDQEMELYKLSAGSGGAMVGLPGPGSSETYTASGIQANVDGSAISQQLAASRSAIEAQTAAVTQSSVVTAKSAASAAESAQTSASESAANALGEAGQGGHTITAGEAASYQTQANHAVSTLASNLIKAGASADQVKKNIAEAGVSMTGAGVAKMLQGLVEKGQITEDAADAGAIDLAKRGGKEGVKAAEAGGAEAMSFIEKSGKFVKVSGKVVGGVLGAALSAMDTKTGGTLQSSTDAKASTSTDHTQSNKVENGETEAESLGHNAKVEAAMSQFNSSMASATKGLGHNISETYQKAADLSKLASRGYSVAHSAQLTSNATASLTVPVGFDSSGAALRTVDGALTMQENKTKHLSSMLGSLQEQVQHTIAGDGSKIAAPTAPGLTQAQMQSAQQESQHARTVLASPKYQQALSKAEAEFSGKPGSTEFDQERAAFKSQYLAKTKTATDAAGTISATAQTKLNAEKGKVTTETASQNKAIAKQEAQTGAALNSANPFSPMTVGEQYGSTAAKEAHNLIATIGEGGVASLATVASNWAGGDLKDLAKIKVPGAEGMTIGAIAAKMGTSVNGLLKTTAQTVANASRNLAEDTRSGVAELLDAGGGADLLADGGMAALGLATAALAEVGGAGYVGYQAGTVLDRWTGASSKVADWAEDLAGSGAADPQATAPTSRAAPSTGMVNRGVAADQAAYGEPGGTDHAPLSMPTLTGSPSVPAPPTPSIGPAPNPETGGPTPGELGAEGTDGPDIPRDSSS
ncbi:hypothetical protein BI364_13700 [Acidihalobacter yilgarnensis]|uniref:TraG N-terminal Proteobacteria domain-containing protein n=1 Tax=Acidihalobacter yilgarnensis TaxID=2819280 RepID=A0A1D8IQV1_9GAMM|nr:conjugal transfer protein TraG N-terminal domain-containing protein [Acidihalobacter yilgarnensis]AOU98872.1 hypothetical protein BI364_13700 [Acidihalobacter yilgarnensis]